MATPLLTPAELRTRLEIAAGKAGSVKKMAEGGVAQRLTHRRLQGLGSQHGQREADRCDAAAFQPAPESLAAFFEAPLQSAQRPAEVLGRFIARQPGEVAQHER